MITLLVISIVLIAASVMSAAYWSIVWWRVGLLLQDRPTVRAGLELADPVAGAWSRLSVIVPAHNEERVIDACCAGLRAQDYPALEIIFVLDRCTDRTAEIVKRHAAEDDRITVIENDACPEDWAGKCNAARLGAERASGEWLLFTDADTVFDPQLCKATVAIAVHRELGLLSLLSDLTFQHHYERVAQPVAAMTLIRMYPFKRLGSSRSVRPFANGQFLLFDRVWYERIGGHAAVKDDLLEDIAFARRLHERDGRFATLLADGMLRVSMYDSLETFRSGWKRIFIEACRRRPRRLRSNGVRLIGNGIVGPIALVGSLLMSIVMFALGDVPLAVALLIAGLAGLLAMALTLARIYRVNGAPLHAVAYFPRGCWIVANVMFEGATDLEQRRPLRWGGREYVLQPFEG